MKCKRRYRKKNRLGTIDTTDCNGDVREVRSRGGELMGGCCNRCARIYSVGALTVDRDAPDVEAVPDAT